MGDASTWDDVKWPKHDWLMEYFTIGFSTYLVFNLPNWVKFDLLFCYLAGLMQ